MLQKFPAVFDVTTLNGANGFQISGLPANSLLGISVSTAGDINGDGIADLVIGAFDVNSDAGAGYVIFGQGSGFPANFDVTTLNGANGFQISGLASNSQLGGSVSTAGDINADGIADLVIGATGVNSNAGAGYVIFGKTSGFPANFDVTTLNGTNGFQISGLASNSQLGFSVSTAGDLNGDGKTDLILGAPNVNSNAGAGYVIFGQASGFPANLNVTTLNGANGFQISGLASNSQLGGSVSTAGDLNGDGKSDLLIGAGGVNSNAGAGYVIFGKTSGVPANFNVTTLNGANGFQINGLPANSDLGSPVSTAGDINGDGIADLVIGAVGVNSFAGAGYVIFGKTSGFPTNFNVTTLNGANGFQISGLASNSQLGSSVSTAGDLNGDGIADLVIGAVGVNSNVGAGYVIFGQGSGFLANFNVTTLNGANGFQISGLASNSFLGDSASTAGDINADGIADLAIGAQGVNSAAGAAYVIFGQNGTPTPMPAPTSMPMSAPTSMPTAAPTSMPMSAPTSMPTAAPTSMPTVAPTSTPTVAPTSTPTVAPTSMPTTTPTLMPTVTPTSPTSPSAPTTAPLHTPTSGGNRLGMPWFSPARVIASVSSLGKSKNAEKTPVSTSSRSSLDFNSQLMLGAVGFYLAKEVAHWVKEWWSGVTDSTAEALPSHDQIRAELGKFSGQLTQISNRLAAQSNAIQGDFLWVKDGLEEYREEIRALASKPNLVTFAQLEDLAADIQYLRKEFSEELRQARDQDDLPPVKTFGNYTRVFAQPKCAPQVIDFAKLAGNQNTQPLLETLPSAAQSRFSY